MKVFPNENKIKEIFKMTNKGQTTEEINNIEKNEIISKYYNNEENNYKEENNYEDKYQINGLNENNGNINEINHELNESLLLNQSIRRTEFYILSK